MKQKMLLRSLIAAAVLVECTGVWAKNDTALVAPGAAAGATSVAAASERLPVTHMQGDVSYLSGGVGLGEANAIKHVARHYPLELVFVRKEKGKDEYLADIKVQIKDAHDKVVLATTADGPYLLAKLPPGRYEISAERGGKPERRAVDIAANQHRRIVFEWLS